MTKIERIEQDIRSLSPTELAAFRKWFTEFDAALWDQQWERDVKQGKLDQLADEALAEHRSLRTKEL